MAFLYFIVIAVAGVVLLGTVRDRPWLRGVAIAVTAALAIGASAAVVSLFALGRRMQWTSEGPGILGVVLALLLCGSFMLMAWSGVWRQLRAPRGGAATLRAGLLLLGVGVAGAVVTGVQHQRTSRPSHDVPVVALAFDASGERLFSLDRDGTLKTWRADDGAPLGSWREASLAAATGLAVAPDGRHALVGGAEGVRVFAIDEDSEVAAVAHFVDAAAGAFLDAGTIALARGTRVEIVPVLAAAAPLRAFDFDTVVDAVASGGGTLAVATRDGSLWLVAADGDGSRVPVALPAPARRLSVSPEGVRVVAVSAEQRAWVISRDGTVDAAPAWMSFGHVGLLGDDLLVAAGDRMPELLSLRMPAFVTSPFLNHGIGVTALAASPARRRVAVAFGENLHLTGELGPDPRAVVASRLVDPRL